MKEIQELLLAEDVFDALEGGKQTTIRLGRRSIDLGELLFESTDIKRQKTVTVTSVRYSSVKNILVDDLKNDGFKDHDDLITQMNRFYPGIMPESEVTTVKFY